MTLPPRSARFRITDLFVRTARPGRHADGDCLYLYVKDTGSRSWVVRAQFDGQRRDFGLGGYPQVARTGVELNRTDESPAGRGFRP